MHSLPGSCSALTWRRHSRRRSARKCPRARPVRQLSLKRWRSGKVLAKLRCPDKDVHVHLELEPPDEAESLDVRRRGEQVHVVATQPYPAADEYLLHLLAHRGKAHEEDGAIRFMTYHLSVEGRIKFDVPEDESQIAPDEEQEEPDGPPEEATPA